MRVWWCEPGRGFTVVRVQDMAHQCGHAVMLNDEIVEDSKHALWWTVAYMQETMDNALSVSVEPTGMVH